MPISPMKNLLVFLIIYSLHERASCQNEENSKIRSTEAPPFSGVSFLMKVLVFSFVFVLLVTIVLIICLCVERQKRKSRYANLNQYDSKMELKKRVDRKEVVYDRNAFEIDPANLNEVNFEEEDGDNYGELPGNFGQGYFGNVRKGILNPPNPEDQRLEPLKVAIKRAHDYEKQELLRNEMLIMCEIKKHPNVLALVGAVTSNKKELQIVMEAAHRDLQTYLRKHPFTFQNQIEWCEDCSIRKKSGFYVMGNFEISQNLNQLSTFDLVAFAYQIANGMKYLASIPCVHRDLALRNILITCNKTIRIGDFGLARRHDETKEYYTKKDKCALPEPRMAPESFSEDKYYNKFSEKSDVWPFALCLYELFTLGRSPMEDAGKWLPDFLANGERFQEPDNCQSEIYEFMKMCWEKDPGQRPSFALCVWVFRCELMKFPNQAYERITEKLESELEKQQTLQHWVRKDINETNIISSNTGPSEAEEEFINHQNSSHPENTRTRKKVNKFLFLIIFFLVMSALSYSLTREISEWIETNEQLTGPALSSSKYSKHFNTSNTTNASYSGIT